MNIFKRLYHNYLEIKLSRLMDERKGAYQFGDVEYVELLDEKIDKMCKKLETTVDDQFMKDFY